jgi:ribonuclease BN (tRNA processing enzyme)
VNFRILDIGGIYLKLTIIGPWGGYPKVNEASAGYILEHDGFNLLIDCGSGVLSKLQQYIKPTDLDACIISHYHPDHNADIGVLQHALLIDMYLTGNKKHFLSMVTILIRNHLQSFLIKTLQPG